MPVRVTRGSLAMSSKATCKDDYLKAPAHVTISRLRVKPKRAKILGFAATSVVEGLKDKGGRLELDVMISGNIRSPNFHITSSLSRAFTGSFAKGLVQDVRLLASPNGRRPDRLLRHLRARSAAVR